MNLSDSKKLFSVIEDYFYVCNFSVDQIIVEKKCIVYSGGKLLKG